GGRLVARLRECGSGFQAAQQREPSFLQYPRRSDERLPHLRTSRKRETARRDADDCRLSSVQAQSLADNLRISPELAAPQPVADHNYVIRSDLGICGPEQPAEDRIFAQDREEIARHGRPVEGQREIAVLGRPRPRAIVLDAGHGLQRTGRVAPGPNLGMRERHQRRSPRDCLRNQSESGLIYDWERAEQYARRDVERRRGPPDSEAKDEDDQPDGSGPAPPEAHGTLEAAL